MTTRIIIDELDQETEKLQKSLVALRRAHPPIPPIPTPRLPIRRQEDYFDMNPPRPMCIEPGCPNPAELAYNGKSYKRRCFDCQEKVHHKIQTGLRRKKQEQNAMNETTVTERDIKQDSPPNAIDELRRYNDRVSAAIELGLDYRRRMAPFDGPASAQSAMEAIDSSLRAVVKVDDSKVIDEEHSDDLEYLQDRYNELRHDATKLGLDVPFAPGAIVDNDEGIWLCTLLYARIQAKQNPPINPHEEALGHDEEESIENFGDPDREIKANKPKPTAPKKKSVVKQAAPKKKSVVKQAAPKKKSVVKKKTPTKKITAAPKKAATKNGTYTPRPGTFTEKIIRLLRRKNGCTGKEILAIIGGKRISVPDLARRAQLKLRVEKKEGSRTVRYYAT